MLDIPVHAIRRKRRRGAVIRAALAASLFGPSFTWAGSQTWTGTTNSNWLTGTNWGGSAPGATGTTSNTDIAAIPEGTTNATTIGIDMGAAGGSYSLGAISMTYTTTNGNVTIDNNSTTTAGTLVLYGATVNSVANVILSDTAKETSSNGQLTIGSTSTTESMGLELGNTSNVIVLNPENGAGNVGRLSIVSNISQLNAGSSLTFLSDGTGTTSTTVGSTLFLSGNNTFTGGIVDGNSAGTAGGTIEFDATGAMPTTGNVTVYTNSAVYLNATGTFGSSGQTMYLNGAGNSTESGALTGSGTLTWAGGVDLQTGSGQATTINASGATTVFTLSGVLSDTGQLQKKGAGTLVLSNTSNSFSGGTLITNGTLSVGSDTELGNTGGSVSIAATSGNSATLAFSSSTLLSTTRALSVAAPISSSTNNITVAANAVVSYGGVIANVPSTVGTLNINISGVTPTFTTTTGTLLLNGTNTYTGPTTVAGGALGGSGSVGGSSATPGGSLTVSAGAFIAPSGQTSDTNHSSASIAQFTATGNVTFTGTGGYVWGLAALSTSSPGTNFDQFVADGSTTSISSTSVLDLDFSFLSTANQPGNNALYWNSPHTWTIIGGTSIITGSFASGNINLFDGTSGDGTFTTTNNTNSISLVYTPSTTNYSWAGTGGTGGTGPWDTANQYWTVAGNPALWANSSANTAFFNQGSGTVTLGTAITAAGLEFDVTGYTIAGSGANTLNAPTIKVSNAGTSATISAQLTSSSGLTKTGLGTLIVTNTSNSYTGGITISGGTLQGNTSSLIGTVADSGILAFDQSTLLSPFTGTFAGLISGTGSVTVLNSGTVTLSNASNSYQGGTFLNGGTLSVAADADLGNTSGGVTFGGGTLQAAAGSGGISLVSTRAVAVGSAGGTFDTNSLPSTIGGGVTVTTGTLNVINGNSTGGLTLAGALTFASGGSLSVASNTSLTLAQASGTINIAGGNFAGNLILNTAARVNFNSGTYTGSGQMQVALASTLITNLSGDIGGTVNNPILLNSTNAAFIAGASNFVTTLGGTGSGTVTLGGVISGASDVNIANNQAGGGGGTLKLSAADTYQGQTLLNTSGGSLVLGITNALPTTTDVVTETATLANLGVTTVDLHGFNQTISSLTDGTNASATARTVIFTNNGSSLSTLTIGGGGAATPSASTGFSGSLTDGPSPNPGTGSNQLALSVTGGVLKLTGTKSTNYTYSGGTKITGGTLLAYSTDTTNGSTGQGLVSVTGTGTLGGKGNIIGAVTVGNPAVTSGANGIITAGNAGTGTTTSTGLLNIVGTTSLTSGAVEPTSGGAIYKWAINSATGTAGASIGWDELTLSTLAVTGSGQVSIDPISLTATGVAGAMANLSPSQAEQWPIATFTSASINGNSSPTPANIAAAFHLDSTTLAAFASANSVPTSDFSISADAGDVYINFSPAPEPTSFGMLLLGAGGLVLRRRRRRTNAPMHDPLIS